METIEAPNLSFCFINRRRPRISTIHRKGCACPVFCVSKEESRQQSPYVSVGKWTILAYVSHHGLPVAVLDGNDVPITIRSPLHFRIFWEEYFVTGHHDPENVWIRKMSRVPGRARKAIPVAFQKVDMTNGIRYELPFSANYMRGYQIDHFFDRYGYKWLMMSYFLKIYDRILPCNLPLECGVFLLPRVFDELTNG